jgi:NitT/TauT family transport system ATP-binding protein
MRDEEIPESVDSPLLVVDGVSKAFDGAQRVRALQQISFTVARGEIVCLVGPSGSGKSTLLRIIGGLTQADTGAVYLDGFAIASPHPAVGLVFQRTNLMPWRTGLENVLLPVEVAHGRAGHEEHVKAEAMLRLVGLEGFEASYPKQLSGGMAQRAVLARALLQAPRLLLLDEPFGSLDALTRERMNGELLRLQSLQQQTILMVTHSISEAVFLADRVLVLSARPGRLVAEVAIDLPHPRQLSLMGTPEFARLSQVVRAKIDQGEKMGAVVEMVKD